MDSEQLVALASQKAKLDHMKAAMLIAAGAQTPFDIQAKTEWRLGRCEVAYQEGCKIFAILQKDINTKSIRSNGKSLQNIVNLLLSDLQVALALADDISFRDRKGMNQALNLALKHTGDYGSAESLLAFYIRKFPSEYGRGKYPALYLGTCFAAYLRKSPRKTKLIKDNELAIGKRLWYDTSTNLWSKA